MKPKATCGARLSAFSRQGVDRARKAAARTTTAESRSLEVARRRSPPSGEWLLLGLVLSINLGLLGLGLGAGRGRGSCLVY